MTSEAAIENPVAPPRLLPDRGVPGPAERHLPGRVTVCFAALALAAIAFVYWFLPETKNLPVEDIVRLFKRDARPHGAG